MPTYPVTYVGGGMPYDPELRSRDRSVPNLMCGSARNGGGCGGNAVQAGQRIGRHDGDTDAEHRPGGALSPWLTVVTFRRVLTPFVFQPDIG